MANLLFLIVFCVVSVMTTDNHGAGKFWVPKLPVRTFAPLNKLKSGLLKV